MFPWINLIKIQQHFARNDTAQRARAPRSPKSSPKTDRGGALDRRAEVDVLMSAFPVAAVPSRCDGRVDHVDEEGSTFWHHLWACVSTRRGGASMLAVAFAGTRYAGVCGPWVMLRGIGGGEAPETWVTIGGCGGGVASRGGAGCG